MSINDRIREIRKSTGLTLRKFAARIGISDSAVSQMELGKSGISDQTILSICREFNISETWLRTGEGRMRGAMTEADELGDAVGQLMADRPDSFKAAVVAALLRFDVDGPEWEVLERIYAEIAAEAEAQAKKKKE